MEVPALPIRRGMPGVALVTGLVDQSAEACYNWLRRVGEDTALRVARPLNRHGIYTFQAIDAWRVISHTRQALTTIAACPRRRGAAASDLGG